MRFNSGWLKLFRRVLFEGIGEREGNSCLGLWIRILGMANLNPREVLFDGQMRTLGVGEILTGLPELANSDRPADISKTRRDLCFLEKRQSIRQTVGKSGRIVTICNWDKYQTTKPDLFGMVTDLATEGRQTGDRPATVKPQLIEEDKKERRKEKEENIRARVTECVEEWKKTLAHFGAPWKPGLGGDDTAILLAIQTMGADNVLLALKGARKQEKTKTFNPAHFLSLDILLRKKNVQRLAMMELGAGSSGGLDWEGFGENGFSGGAA